MLIQFSATNFLSFKDEMLLNLIPVKSRTMKDHIISDDEGKRTDVLPIATIFGANASGKTNLVNAMAYAQKLILQGTRSDNATGVTPFLLDTENENAPTRFEFVFKHKGILYTYGFLLSNRIIHEEWLFARYTTQESRVFERKSNEKRTIVEPGPRLIAETKGSQFIDFIAQGTRPNQLFLTEANEKNISLLKPVFHWFQEHLHIIRPNSQYRALALRAHKDKDFINFLSHFLSLADTGIQNIQCESEPFNAEKHLVEFPEKLRTQILEDLEAERFKQLFLQTPREITTICRENQERKISTKFLRLKTEHLKSDGSTIAFRSSAESDGTRRLIDLAPMLQDIWERDRVFVIDELDRSLHTHLSRLFIQACIAGVINKKARGQFIMTTHDTNLLDRNLLRRDEIWFMERDKAGASHLTSLAEYKVSDGLNYENGYLNGRFGAIPFIGSIDDLMKE